MMHVGMQSSAAMGMSLGYPPQSSSPSVSTQIEVPDELVGVIVGKAGAVLKGIIATTGARIKVTSIQER
jgi:hypothetical protein